MSRGRIYAYYIKEQTYCSIITERSTVMYKDDNVISGEGCSEALLKMMLTDPAQVIGASSDCQGNATSAKRSLLLQDFPLASVYSPLQEYRNIYDLDTALKRGTIFSELDLPFDGRSLSNGGKYNA